ALHPDRGHLGDPDRLVPAVAPAGLPHGAAAASFRAGRVERGQHRRAVLDHRGPRGRLGPRPVLPGLPAGGGVPVVRPASAAQASRDGEYDGRRVLIGGTGVAGAACAEVLLSLGARVTVLDRGESETFVRLREAGAATVLGETVPEALLAELDDVIVSPGF